jgi:hypothetical protein
VLALVIPSNQRWLRLRLVLAVLGVIGFLLLATIGLVPGATTAASGGGCGEFRTFPFGVGAACIGAHFNDVQPYAYLRFATANRDASCLIRVTVIRDDPQATQVADQQFHCPGAAGIALDNVRPFFGGLRGVYRAELSIVGTGFTMQAFSPWLHLA